VTKPPDDPPVEVRTSARVILIDPDDRVLLLAARDPADGKIVWFVPGGGVEEGETPHQAAVRELAEEVPLAGALALAGPVWTRHHDFSWAGHGVSQTEWFFVARLAAPLDAAAISLDGNEAQFFAGARWATLAELETWPDLLAPRRFSELLAPILAGELPSEPVDAGV
jgi:8-oxo-dGTP pyrophosphatase MutT (NUDIX family)